MFLFETKITRGTSSTFSFAVRFKKHLCKYRAALTVFEGISKSIVMINNESKIRETDL